MVISHKISTIKNCDRIIVLSNGKIIQEESLILWKNKNGLFRKLCNKQNLKNHKMDKISLKDLKDKIFVIAEIGNNHEGNFKRCLDLIDKAKNCGVDAVKLQPDPDLFYERDKKDLYN